MPPTTAPPVDLDAVRDVLGPLGRWARDCHAASLYVVRSGVLGPEACVARGVCRGVGGQHSWVVLGDPYDQSRRIVDPTLWSYDPTVVGIWTGFGVERHRPHGSGSIWDWGRPEGDGGEPIALTPKTPLSEEAEFFLDMLGPLDRAGWMRLSGAPVGGWPAAEIIAAMDDTPALEPLVPIDILGMLTDRNPGGLYR